MSNLQLNDRGIAPLLVQSTASTHGQIMPPENGLCQGHDQISGISFARLLPLLARTG
ncbi:hypothetical protein [Paraburkholderia sacchari]|uniref:hypothetical protein n=1 Tax=Paraburkholderia sacchari TaxID=159450 RepID=UPI003D96F180